MRWRRAYGPAATAGALPLKGHVPHAPDHPRRRHPATGPRGYPRLEAPEADKAAILREALDWLAEHPPKVAADALYYRERLEVIRLCHGAA